MVRYGKESLTSDVKGVRDRSSSASITLDGSLSIQNGLISFGVNAEIGGTVSLHHASSISLVENVLQTVVRILGRSGAKGLRHAGH